MLEIQNVSKTFNAGTVNQKTALNGLNLKLNEGDFVTVIGGNGAGKSTMLNAVAGVWPVDEGKIIIDGVDVTRLSEHQRAAYIGRVFQDPMRGTAPHMTIEENLALAAGSEKLTREEGCQYLTRVGLCAADYIDREVDASLSGGEVKRIEIATILARKSGLMIFDEPEAGIDLWSFAKLTETFKAIHQKREATLIVISHQERIIDLADEIVMIRDGKIAKHGPKDEIFPQILANTSAGCSYMSEGAR